MTNQGNLSGRGLLAGAAAGAAGTTALNAVTYIDMALRGRPASSTPEETVEKLSQAAGVPIPGDEQTRANRVAGLGPLTGVLVGVGTGALLGVMRSAGIRPGLTADTLAAAAGVMTTSTAPMTALGIVDPRSWTTQAWISDLIPHLAYGAVTAAVLRYLDSSRADRSGLGSVGTRFTPGHALRRGERQACDRGSDRGCSGTGLRHLRRAQPVRRER